MSFTVICDKCKSTDVDIQLYDEKALLYCNNCSNEQIWIVYEPM